MKLEFHHINIVSKNVDELNNFYKNILQMDSISETDFPRTKATESSGYNGKIKFVTEGKVQMHLAERDFDVAKQNNRHINPVERGHIAFRTDDLKQFIKILKKTYIDLTKLKFFSNAFKTEEASLSFNPCATAE